MKTIKRVSIVFILIILITLFYFIFNGYILYKEAIDKKSIEDRISEIVDDEHFVSHDEVPDYYLKAVVSIEDHRFYSHGGVDIISTGRAFITNIKARKLVEGRKFHNSTGC